MSWANEVRQESFWLAGGAGRLFATLHCPSEPPRLLILTAPALAEEHLWSLPALTRLARALAAHSVATLQIDLRGAGESEGDNRINDLAGYLEDLETGRGYLTQQFPGKPLLLLGLRFGAALGIRLAAGGVRWDGACLVAPVLDPAAYVAELLRSARIGQLVRRNQPPLAAGAPEKASRAADALTVEGYTISRAFLEQLAGWEMQAGFRQLGPTLVAPFAPQAGRVAPEAWTALQERWPGADLTVTTPLPAPFWVEDRDWLHTRHERLEAEIIRWIQRRWPAQPN